MTVRIADDMQIVYRVAPFKTLGIDMPVLGNFNFQPLGKRVYNGGTNAVQTAGNFIAAAAEFTARVQNSENNRYRRQSCFFVNAGGNSAPVITHADHIIRQNFTLNMGADAGKRLVYRIINNFIHKVVKSPGPGGADIHARPFAHRLKAFQHLNILGGIFLGYGSIHIFFFQNDLAFFSDFFAHAYFSLPVLFNSVLVLSGLKYIFSFAIIKLFGRS